MVKGKIIVSNQSGLHMRPAIMLTKTASMLKSSIKIISDGNIIDPKKILDLMNARIQKGSEITIVCEGETEEEDLQVLLDAIAAGLGESI